MAYRPWISKERRLATSIGHAPIAGLIDPKAGSVNGIAESLTNLIWAPLEDGLASVSLSANWMWPCKNEGEDARLYDAVQACSEFAIALGINIPTGKDSLSMKQKYADQEVIAPGTVIISAGGHCSDINKIIEPGFKNNGQSIYYIDMSKDSYQLGGSSFYQSLNAIGNKVPTVKDSDYFKKVFNAVQAEIKQETISSGHDISAGGIITTLLESCFPNKGIGANIDLTALGESDALQLFFAENNGIVIQITDEGAERLADFGVEIIEIGTVVSDEMLSIKNEVFL